MVSSMVIREKILKETAVGGLCTINLSFGSVAEFIQH